ncbi:MAG: L(+)-tartrate dehydratase subunit beta [Spirochaetes bacterium]|nr:L(+)-tartrate dehydratase subunit beta [Spirochaetota bacterium]
MKKILNLPLYDNDVSGLKAGDIVYLSGLLITGRDEVYRRVTEEKMALPVDIKGMANYHAGPIVRKKDNEWELVSIGPTSSIRLEKWTEDFIEKTGIKVMIGKGGMGEKTVSACRKYKVIHCIYPGGCAVLGASQIERIENVYWRELGMAECLWVMKTCEFGPLIVSIDAYGNSLFSENSAYYEEFKRKILSDFPFFS